MTESDLDWENRTLCKDESCIGVEDVLTCADMFDGINIKLCKCGGIRRALQMIHICRALLASSIFIG